MPSTGLELENKMLDMIYWHKYADDGKFLTDQDAMELFGASRTAVRNAIDSLVKQGYLFRVRGKGTFVNEPFNGVPVSSFVDPMFMLGRTGVARSRIMSRKEVAKASKFIAGKLGIKPFDPVLRVDLIIDADGQPACYTISYIPYERFPEMEPVDYSNNYTYKVLKDFYDVDTKYWKHAIKAASAPIEVAEALSLAAYSPTLVIDSVGFGSYASNPDVDIVTEYCCYYCKSSITAFSCIQKCNMDILLGGASNSASAGA